MPYPTQMHYACGCSVTVRFTTPKTAAEIRVLEARGCLNHRRKGARRALKDLEFLGIPTRRRRIYVLIGNEPFEECIGRIRRVMDLGAEPFVLPLRRLDALSPAEYVVAHDWTPSLLRRVARWTNRHLWKYTTFADYNRRRFA